MNTFLNLLQTVSNAGTGFATSDKHKSKIRLTNQVALVTAAIVLPFACLVAFLYPDISTTLFLSVILSLCVPVLNAVGYTQLSRVVHILQITTLLLISHGQLLQAGESFIAPLYLAQFSLFLLPWLLFSLNDRDYLGSLSLYAALTVFMLPAANSYFDNALNNQLFREPVFFNILLASSFLAVSVCLYYFLKTQQNIRYKNEELLARATQDRKLLEQKEADLTQNMQILKANHQQENNRQWVSEGMEQLHNIMQKYQDEKGFYEKVISHLSKYTAAAQGCFFKAESYQESEWLSAVGCYAYNKVRHFKTNIQPGQGLVGQTYLEKLPIFLTEIPNGYAEIASGLGRAKPQALLIQPVLNEKEEVLAIFEIAFIKKPEAHVLQFLEMAARSLSATIQQVNSRLTTEELLEEAKLMAEQTQAQEEMLRQNMEYIMKEQQKLEEKEGRYKQELATLRAALLKERNERRQMVISMRKGA